MSALLIRHAFMHGAEMMSALTQALEQFQNHVPPAVPPTPKHPETRSQYWA